MENVFWVLPKLLAGRPGPTKKPWQLEQLREAGFNTVINLSEVPPDTDEFNKYGIESFWCPLPTAVPADKQAELDCVATLPKAYNYLSSSLDKKHTVLVHCIGGRDRTGLLLSFYVSMTSGLSIIESIDKIKSLNSETLTSEGWEAMAINVISSLTKL